MFAQDTLFWFLFNQAKNHPDKVYYYNQGKAVSYGDACQAALNIAVQLRCQIDHLETNPLAVIIRDPNDFLPFIWASLAENVCIAFLPDIRDVKQIWRLMNQVQASTLVTDMPELLIQPFSISVKSLMAKTAVNAEFVPSIQKVGHQTPAILFQTSSTTGQAKWVCVSQEQYFSAIECMQQLKRLQHAAEQVVYITPPLNHSYGLSSMLEYTSMGSTLILPNQGTPLGAVGMLIRNQAANLITAIEGVPYCYFQMSQLIDRIELPSLKHIGIGGGPINLNVVDQLQNKYPYLSYSIRYGLTETPSIVSNKIFLPPYEDNWKSSGSVLPIYDLQIVDDRNNPLPNYQEGEIQIQGKCLALPYFVPGSDGQATCKGFFATGDVGYLDRNNELYITGRKSTFIKNGGYRFSPEDVESMIMLYNGVKDCRVKMVDKELLAEVVITDTSFSITQLLAFLANKLPNYTIPKEVHRVQEIARTASGKVKRD